MTATPGPRALEAARTLLRALSAARQVYSLYPDGHPDRRKVVDEALRAIRRLVDDSGGEAVLFVTRHSFYLGTNLLARESLSLFRLAESFERAGVEALELFPTVRAEDVDALVQVLHGDKPVGEWVGGIAVNRVRPTLPGAPEREVRMTELRHAYATGLELLRETALRIASGRAVDLDAATVLVERIADEVISDPAHALLLTTVKSYDEYTYYHLVNVCMLSVAMGHAIGLHRDQVISLGLGGLLHDVGKVNLPDDILKHVGKLTEEQWRLVQRHPVEGAGLMFATREGLFHPAATVVLEHHAAYDLSGYPPLSGRERPALPSRLVAVADCFDAVTSRRAYRAPTDRRDALAILESAAGSGFDPRLVRVFVRLLGLFPVGSLVALDSGEVGLVVANHESLLARPTVRVLLDANGDPVEQEERDLATGHDGDYRWNVVRSLDPDELGLDVMELMATGSLDLATAPPAAPPTGLVHEPSYGERPPEDYVHTHDHLHEMPGAIDPDVAPPFPD